VGGEDVWVWECGWVLCVSPRPSGRQYQVTARSLTNIQGKPEPSPGFSISRWKSDPNSILLNEFPLTGDSRIHLMGSDRTSLTAGRVSSLPTNLAGES